MVAHPASLAEIRARIDAALAAKQAHAAVVLPEPEPEPEPEPTLSLPPELALTLPPIQALPLPPIQAGARAGAQAGHRIERVARRIARRAPDSTDGDRADGDRGDDEAAVAEFTARVAAKAAARAAGAVQIPSSAAGKTDWARVAAAHAAKAGRAGPAAAVAPKPLAPAVSREECRACGIPGSRGCAHQLPYAEDHLGLTARRGGRHGRRSWD